ncbi:hypothetical protein FJU08_20425 [Martelella alba]|uniref:Uncharacterized protein n=1 Tax=Martelella alba TaxID=2590451 RepID=A0A506U306_9HYPH|nr:hypothetical protein [Martelella alba]TPW27375.1 hypothetical protein FJU08_20425 [Martelella alba]
MDQREQAIAQALGAGLDRIVASEEADILSAAESAHAFRAALRTPDSPADEVWPPMQVRGRHGKA